MTVDVTSASVVPVEDVIRVSDESAFYLDGGVYRTTNPDVTRPSRADRRFA
jgi:hypothetical protein